MDEKKECYMLIWKKDMNKDKIFWNKAAKFYTAFMLKNSKTYESLSELISPYLTKDMHALEIGCGTGQLSFFLSDRLKHLTATDFSEEMIDICRTNNYKENLDFQVEDAGALHFEDAMFDAIIIANVLHIVPDADSVIEEVKRVLKNGGIVVAPTFVYNYKRFNLSIWFLEKIGFKTYRKFSEKEYIDYLRKKGFILIYIKTLPGKPLSECLAILRKDV